MTNDWIKLISADIYEFVFKTLDTEHDMSGDEAGRVATAVQKAFDDNVSWLDHMARAEELIRDADRDGTLEYEIECLEEDASIVGNAMASGDDDFDDKCEQSILADLWDGNEWAWCTVKVSCSVPGYNAVGYDCLGCCNYRNQADFEACDYYDDMRGEARAELITSLAAELA